MKKEGGEQAKAEKTDTNKTKKDVEEGDTVEVGHLMNPVTAEGDTKADHTVREEEKQTGISTRWVILRYITHYFPVVSSS